MAGGLLARPPASTKNVLVRRGRTFDAFGVEGFAYLWASGWCWNITRWMAIFLCSYFVNRVTGSPFLVQVVGAAFFAPMFFGGIIAGTVADRFDRRRTILQQLLLLVPLALLLGGVVTSGAGSAWMVYPFMIAVGVGGVVDMTSRRALIFDLVGEDRATNALALESLSMAGGTTLGTLLGGTLIAVAGVGPGFFVIAALYGMSFLLLKRVPSPQARIHSSPSGSVADSLMEGIRAIRKSEALIGVLAVTVIMNLFYFPFTPLIPVFADQMGVNAFFAGLLASGVGFGMLAGSLVWASWPTVHRGVVYVAGSALALTFLFAFASSDWYPLALAFLFTAGFGSSAFGTMQGVLVMTSAEPKMRGRAMGTLSMAIGTLPFGMIGLGALAQATAPAAAVMFGALMGIVALGLWAAWRPAAYRTR